MTTLYKPVLIESAEQAEALPEGALVPIEDKDGPWEKRPDGKFQGAGRVVVDVYRVLDRIALVPIEAEEEWAAEFEPGEMYVNLDEDTARAADGGTAMSRLVTPWEAE